MIDLRRGGLRCLLAVAEFVLGGLVWLAWLISRAVVAFDQRLRPPSQRPHHLLLNTRENLFYIHESLLQWEAEAKY